MSFLETVAAETRANGAKCRLPDILATLPKEQAAEVRAAIYDRRYQIAAVVRAASKADLPITKGMVERHRADDTGKIECKTCRS